MASNLRVLVSNMDGNWGHWDYNTDSLNNDNQATADGNYYFPPGTGSAAPTETQMFFAGDYAAWTSKSNWLFQVDGTFGGGRVDVVVGRPTGIEETVVTNITTNTTWGGCSSFDGTNNYTEALVGPITYVKFVVGGATNPDLRFYIIAWNEGDIYDGVAKRA